MPSDPAPTQIVDEKESRLSAVFVKGARESGMAEYRPIEVCNLLLVVLVIGLSIRTFFLQPHRISTGSMEPTITAGDRVLLDRMSYNFRRPRRGEIVALQTVMLPDIAAGKAAFFVKRLVGLPGESISIADDRHVHVGEKRLTSADKGFERVYTFTGPARAGVYSGHVNQESAARYSPSSLKVAPRFPNAGTVEELNLHEVFVLGDNTMVSQDSRSWGPIPTASVAGRVWLVYWPWSSRLGWMR